MSFFASYPVARFKQARKEFIQVAGIADFDPKAKARATELREEMHRASQEIALRTRRASDRRARGHRSSGQKLRPPGRAGTRTRKGQGIEKDKGLEKVNLRGTFSEANPARRGLAAGRNVYRNAANIAKQGIDFEDAIRILDGPVG